MISDLNYQLELLSNLHQYLERVQDDLDAAVQNSDSQINQLEQAGLVPQYVADFRGNAFEETRASIGRLIDQLQMVDKAKVRVYEGKIRDALPD